jgi:hypothetical protein
VLFQKKTVIELKNYNWQETVINGWLTTTSRRFRSNWLQNETENGFPRSGSQQVVSSRCQWTRIQKRLRDRLSAFLFELEQNALEQNALEQNAIK